MTPSALRRSLPVLALILTAATPVGSHAVDVRPIIKAGFDFGGDTVVSVGVTGGSSSSKSIKANDGIFVGGGASILTDSRELEVEVSLSFKFFTIAALVFYRMPNVRLGGGLTYHLSPTLSGSGAASDLNAKYGDALGFVLQ